MAEAVLVKLESVGSETDSRGLHPPFSVLYLADSLEKAGFTVKVIHEEGTKKNIESLIHLIRQEKPAFVGFSVLTGPQIAPSLAASKAVKNETGLPILWGGLQPSLLPEKVLEKQYIDVLSFGEGEETIVDLAKMFRTPGWTIKELAKIAGIAFRKNGEIVSTGSRPFIKNLDNISASWHHLDIERYIRPDIYLDSSLGGKRAIAVNTSRGCPWRCGYCYNLTFNRRIFRAQTASRVIEEIEELKRRFQISAIRFSEDHFFSNRRRALQIIHRIGIPWSATIRINDLTEGGDEFVKDLAENQCALLRCGVESGSQRILDLICKDITLDQIREAAGLCAKYGVVIGFFFMLGFPGETWADILQTLDIMDELESMGKNIIVALPSLFCPYPGTPLLEEAVKRNFKPPKDIEGWGAEIDEIPKKSGHLPAYMDGRVERVIDYLRLARVQVFHHPALFLPMKILRSLARMRWKHRFFSFPVDWYIASFGQGIIKKAGKPKNKRWGIR